MKDKAPLTEFELQEYFNQQHEGEGLPYYLIFTFIIILIILGVIFL